MRRFLSFASTALLAAALGAFVPSQAHAAVSVIANSLAGGAAAPQFVLPTGGSNTGGIIRLGTVAPADVGSLSSRNIDVVHAVFNPLGETAGNTDGRGTGGPISMFAAGVNAGKFGGSILDINTGVVPTGTPIYMIAYGSSDPDTATDFVVVNDPAWLIPPDPGSITLFTQQIQDADILTQGVTIESGNIALVPEPSVVLFLLGALGALGLRRNRAG